MKSKSQRQIKEEMENNVHLKSYLLKKTVDKVDGAKLRPTARRDGADSGIRSGESDLRSEGGVQGVMDKRCGTRAHCAMLGDGMVGKTCLTLSYTQRHFNDHYTATVFDNYTVPISMDGEEFAINLFDTAGQNDYESVRAFTYNSSDVLMLCFSVCDRESFHSVTEYWLPEIHRHTQSKRPVLLVGTQTDLRSSPSHAPSEDEVSKEEGDTLAKMIGADGYIECSAKSQESLRNVFQHVVLSVLKFRKKKASFFSRVFGH